MKKTFTLILAFIMLFTMVACGGSDITAEPPPTTAPSPTPSTQISDMPTLSGSNAYDAVVALSENGIPQPAPQHTDDGFRWDSNTDKYAYSFISDSNHEIGYAKFMVLSGDGKNYITYCSTIIYDTADDVASQAFINDNFGKEAEITIGDAVFKLSKGNTGVILEIEAVGYAEYLDAQLDALLGLS